MSSLLTDTNSYGNRQAWQVAPHQEFSNADVPGFEENKNHEYQAAATELTTALGTKTVEALRDWDPVKKVADRIATNIFANLEKPIEFSQLDAVDGSTHARSYRIRRIKAPGQFKSESCWDENLWLHLFCVPFCISARFVWNSDSPRNARTPRIRHVSASRVTPTWLLMALLNHHPLYKRMDMEPALEAKAAEAVAQVCVSKVKEKITELSVKLKEQPSTLQLEACVQRVYPRVKPDNWTVFCLGYAKRDESTLAKELGPLGISVTWRWTIKPERQHPRDTIDLATEEDDQTTSWADFSENASLEDGPFVA